MPGIGVLSNPRSRQNRRRPRLIDRLREVAAPLGDGAIVRSTASPEELQDAVRLFRERRIDVLALNGGDGTNHVSLTEVIAAWGDQPLPKIALLRGGTMNTVARGMGIRSGRPEQLLAGLCAASAAGEPIDEVDFDVLRVQSEAAQRSQYGFIFGNGAFAGFLEVYYSYPEPSPWVAAKTLGRVMTAVVTGGELRQRLFGKVEVELSWDGEPPEAAEILAVCAATEPEVGLGFAPWYRASERPGTLHGLAIGCSPWALLGLMPRMYAAKPTDHPAIVDRVCERLEIRSERPLPFIIDGDYHPPTRAITLSTGPRLTILRPPRGDGA